MRTRDKEHICYQQKYRRSEQKLQQLSFRVVVYIPCWVAYPCILYTLRDTRDHVVAVEITGGSTGQVQEK